MMMVDGDEVVGDVGPTPKASPLTVQPTLGGLAPMLKRIRPLGSLVRNLKEIVPVFTASHFGKICTQRNIRYKRVTLKNIFVKKLQ